MKQLKRKFKAPNKAKPEASKNTVVEIDDLIGTRFNSFLVIGKVPNCIGVVLWQCVCDCGKICCLLSHSLKGGKITNCGCAKVSKHETHGMSRSRIYGIWNGMLGRCLNEKTSSYHRYGGAGITVCEEWLKFDNFYCDMGATYGENLSLDRINGKLGYSKNNCRWATRVEQARNKDKCIKIEYQGETRTAVEWEDLLGLTATVRYRKRKGWGEEECLFGRITDKLSGLMKYSEENAQAVKKFLVGTIILEQSLLELKDSTHQEIKQLGTRLLKSAKAMQNYFIYHPNTDEQYRALFKRQFLNSEIVLYGEIMATIQNLSEDSLVHVLESLRVYVSSAEDVVEESGETL